MSLIVAACSREKIIIAGDTQLNDDNGPLPFTGMKVVPVGNTMVAGLAGDYEGYRKVADYFSSKPELHFLSFQDKAEAICSLLHHSGVKCNFVLAGFENNVPQIVCTGTDYGYRYHIEQVNNGTVRTLLPPDVTDEMCRRFFTSIYGLKIQTVNCIRGVSRISQSVNDKICGFEITPHSLKCVTDGIKYEDISVRIIPVNP